MSADIPFSLAKTKPLNIALYYWWHLLQQQELDDKLKELIEERGFYSVPPVSTAARSELSRSQNLDQVLLSSHYQRLYQWLVANHMLPSIEDFAALTTRQRIQLNQLAVAVGILASIRTDAPNKSTGKLMSYPDDRPSHEPPILSELRFRRLLACTDLDDLYSQLKRAIPILNRTMNVQALIAEIGNWDSQYQPTARTWAYDYVWPTKQSS